MHTPPIWVGGFLCCKSSGIAAFSDCCRYGHIYPLGESDCRGNLRCSVLSPHAMSSHDHPSKRLSHASTPSSSYPFLSPLIPGLPDDVAMLVLARLPRALTVSLKSVSKAWKHMLEQPQLRETRLNLGCLEEWLYIETWNSTTGKLSWFSFDTQTSKWFGLPPIPKKRGHSPEVFGRVSAVFDGKLYVMGGKAGRNGPTLRDLFIYCPYTNRWSRGRRMLNTRHSPLVSVLDGKLYVLGGFDWNNMPLKASESYDFADDEWDVVESAGHPRVPAPTWYKKGWHSEWQGINLHNTDYYCSYKEEGLRICVKHYDPETGAWEIKKPKLKALLRYGLSTVLAGKLHTVDWAAGRVRVADSSGVGWIHVKDLETLPWVQIWRANPQMVGIGTSLYVVKRGLQIMSIDVSKVESRDVLRFWDAPGGPGVEDEEVISCQVLAA